MPQVNNNDHLTAVTVEDPYISHIFHDMDIMYYKQIAANLQVTTYHTLLIVVSFRL